MCAGVRRRVRAVVRRHVRAVVRGCARVCAGVRGRSCAGVGRCAQVCAGELFLAGAVRLAQWVRAAAGRLIRVGMGIH